MPLTATCPNCSTKLRVPDELAGRRVKCSQCGTAFAVEASRPDPAAAIQNEPRPTEPARRRPRDADEVQPRSPKKKKSNTALIIGLVVGVVLLGGCCCIGGGVGIYYGTVGSNAKVNEQNFKQLKTNMTLSEVEALIGSGSQASLSDVNDFFANEMDARIRNAFERGAPGGQVYRWRNGDVRIMILFNNPPKSGGRALYFEYVEKSANGRRSIGMGTLPEAR
jgi:predicted Zn finger-like uncharacterized protein